MITTLVGSFQPRPRSSDELQAGTTTARGLRSTVDEYIQASASVQQAAALPEFGDKPLIVRTAGIGHDAAWSTVQNHLATLSTTSVHRIVDGAAHEALVADRVGCQKSVWVADHQ